MDITHPYCGAKDRLFNCQRQMRRNGLITDAVISLLVLLDQLRILVCLHRPIPFRVERSPQQAQCKSIYRMLRPCTQMSPKFVLDY